jgi:hypothetical protein
MGKAAHDDPDEPSAAAAFRQQKSMWQVPQSDFGYTLRRNTLKRKDFERDGV